MYGNHWGCLISKIFPSLKNFQSQLYRLKLNKLSCRGWGWAADPPTLFRTCHQMSYIMPTIKMLLLGKLEYPPPLSHPPIHTHCFINLGQFAPRRILLVVVGISYNKHHGTANIYWFSNHVVWCYGPHVHHCVSCCNKTLHKKSKSIYRVSPSYHFYIPISALFWTAAVQQTKGEKNTPK